VPSPAVIPALVAYNQCCGYNVRSWILVVTHFFALVRLGVSLFDTFMSFLSLTGGDRWECVVGGANECMGWRGRAHVTNLSFSLPLFASLGLLSRVLVLCIEVRSGRFGGPGKVRKAVTLNKLECLKQA